MPRDEKEHDWALWFAIQSTIFNLVLIALIVFAMIRSDWNAGWVACANNHDIVKVEK